MHAAIGVGDPPSAGLLLEVVGANRYLPVTARDVQDVGRLAETREIAPECGHERAPLAERGAVMRCASGEVALVQVIGLDPALHQLAEERAERLEYERLIRSINKDSRT